MLASTWFAFLIACWVISLSPGAGAIASMSCGLQYGFWRGYWNALGLQIGLAIVVVTLVVLFSGLPIAWGLTLVAVGFLAVFGGPDNLANVPLLMMDELASFALLTIPLFVLLGAAVSVSAAGRDLYESLHRWLDRIPGGLVIANILAGPLITLAPDIGAATAPGGHAILAGLIARQMEPVLAAYRAQGFRLAARGGSAEWPCLLLAKRRRYGYRRKERAFHRASPSDASFGSW